MSKRLTYLTISAVLIILSVMLCIGCKKETPPADRPITDSEQSDTVYQPSDSTENEDPLSTDCPITDAEQSDTADQPSDSTVNEDLLFDKSFIVDTLQAESTDEFSEIDTVDANSFNFAWYLPIVFFDTVSTPRGGYYRDYAILSEGGLEEGTLAFNKIKQIHSADNMLNPKTSEIEAPSSLDALKTDEFYKMYARNNFYNTNSDGVRIVETDLNVFEITMPDGRYYRMATKNSENYRFQIEQVIDGRYFLLTVFYIDYDWYTDVRGFATYLCDTETEELTLLEKYAVNPMLSPDMKYLIYTGQTARQRKDGFNGLNQLHHQDRGFYVKNIESSETFFCGYGNDGSFADYGCIGWIETDEFNDLVSTSPMTVTLDTSTQKFFENTRELPEKDDSLKTIKVPFPEDFPMLNYTEPELTEPKDFDFGEYMLNVSFTIGNVTASHDVYTNSFLGKGIETVNDGRSLFDQFNEKYMIRHPLNNIYEGHGSDYVTPNSFLGSYLYNSRTVSISPDGRNVVTASITDAFDANPLVKYWYSYDGWMGRKDYYVDGKVVASELSDKYFEGVGNSTVNLPSYSPVYYDGDWVIIDEYFGDADIYSRSRNEWVCHLNLPNEYTKNEDGSLFLLGCTVRQLIDDRYLLLDLQKTFDGTSAENPTYSHCTYLYDLESEEYTYLGSYMFETTISPDKRYLAYQSCWPDYIPDMSKNNLSEMKSGFFILDLETKKTTFYSSKGYGWVNIAGWVSRSAIDSTIAHEGSFVDPEVEQREDIQLLKSGENTVKTSISIDPRTHMDSGLKWINSKNLDYGNYFPLTENSTFYNFISNTNESEKTLYEKLCDKLELPQNAKLIYVSEEADKFGSLYYGTKDGEPDTYKLVRADGTVEFQLQVSEGSLLDNMYGGVNITGYVPPEQDCYYSIYTVDDFVLYSSFNGNSETVYIYDGNNPEPLYEIAFPIITETDSEGNKIMSFCEIDSLSASGHAVIYTKSVETDTYSEYTTINGCYFTDLNSGKLTPLDTNLRSAMISPDGNNLFGYFYNNGDIFYLYVDTKSGEYAKYPGLEIICWVNSKSILEFTEQ